MGSALGARKGAKCGGILEITDGLVQRVDDGEVFSVSDGSEDGDVVGITLLVTVTPPNVHFMAQS